MTMIENLETAKLKNLEGKAAVFVRGLMDFVESVKDPEGVHLRHAQDAGMAAVIEADEVISVPYISKLTVLLQACRVVRKERRGKKYMLFPDLNYIAFVEHMEKYNYGISLEKGESMDRVIARSKFLDFMQENPGVRIARDNTLDKAAYQIAMDKFKRGEYDMVFVKREYQTILAVNHDKGIEEEVTSMNVAHASVAHQ